jgi:hypothetical protein
MNVLDGALILSPSEGYGLLQLRHMGPSMGDGIIR